MTFTVVLRRMLLAAALACSLPAAAQPAGAPEALVAPIQARWAEIKYQQPAKAHPKLYRSLAEQAHQISETHPNVAAVLIWEGIVLSSEAGARGGLGALSLAKDAKALLEESLKLDERALDGSAYTSLATLYAKVPGWPLGFGDKARAEVLFKKSLAINPDGIDPNYFYGEYLIEAGRLSEGRAFLERALNSPPRPGRELADQGRQGEIRALLARVAGEGS